MGEKSRISIKGDVEGGGKQFRGKFAQTIQQVGQTFFYFVLFLFCQVGQTA